MLSNSAVMESITAWVNSTFGFPSSVSTTRIARRLTDATVACVEMKLLQRFVDDASGTLRLITSPTAGSTAAETWVLRRMENRDPVSGFDRAFSVRPDRSNARTLLSIACCAVLASGTWSIDRLYRDASMLAAVSTPKTPVCERSALTT